MQTEEQLMVLTENFEEEHPGVFVGVKGLKLPLLMPFIFVNDFPEEKMFEESYYETIKEELEGAVVEYGSVVGLTRTVRGYPVQRLPANVDIPRLIQFNDQYFRLYHLFVEGHAGGVSCYVPYSESMSDLDLWSRRHDDHPVVVPDPSKKIVHTSDGEYTIH